MSKKSNIQWCDSTVNPVMGCDGCPLYPEPKQVMNLVIRGLESKGIAKENARAAVKEVFGDKTVAVMYHPRRILAEEVLKFLEEVQEPKEIKKAVESGIQDAVRCYAGVLHMRHGEDPLNPEKGVNKGYAPSFEKVTVFGGRTIDMANSKDLVGRPRKDAPWLDGLPRLIFVSDMGDALSKDVPFDYLKKEIVDVAASVAGRSHVWLWLTKQGKRMLEFSK